MKQLENLTLKKVMGILLLLIFSVLFTIYCNFLFKTINNLNYQDNGLLIISTLIFTGLSSLVIFSALVAGIFKLKLESVWFGMFIVMCCFAIGF